MLKYINILVINPNSDLEMTQLIDSNAKRFVSAWPNVKVHTAATEGANKFIATYLDQAKSLAGMVKILKENVDEYDAFIIACHADPNLDVMKEIAHGKPVIGIAEASMKMATMLGHSFSVIAPSSRGVPNKYALANKYNLSRDLASVRAADINGTPATRDALIEAAKKAVDEDHAEVLVLGCAGFVGLDKDIESVVHVPVLDGVICALTLAIGLVHYKVGISKLCRYR